METVPLSVFEDKDYDKLVIEGVSDYNDTKMICYNKKCELISEK